MRNFYLLLSIPMLEIDSSGYMNQLQGALDRFNQAQIKSDDSVLQFHFHRLILLLCKERSLACLQTIPMIKLKTFLAEDQHTALRARLGIWESHKTPLEDITYYLQNVLLEANTRSLVHGSSMVIPRLSMVSSLFQPENEEEDENDEEMVPPLLVRKSS